MKLKIVTVINERMKRILRFHQLEGSVKIFNVTIGNKVPKIDLYLRLCVSLLAYSVSIVWYALSWNTIESLNKD